MRAALTLVALTSLVVAGCGNGGDTAEVEMRLIAYRPERLEVEVGERVRWVQRDAGAHTVTSGRVIQEAAGVRTEADDRFASEQLATGDTYAFEFTKSGSYPYFCEIHPATMRGEIVVT